MKTVTVLAPDQAIALARRPSFLSRVATGAVVLAASGISALAQTDPQIVTDAVAKIGDMEGYASTLGTAALGVVAIIAIITLAIKFLRRG